MGRNDVKAFFFLGGGHKFRFFFMDLLCFGTLVQSAMAPSVSFSFLFSFFPRRADSVRVCADIVARATRCFIVSTMTTSSISSTILTGVLLLHVA